jgi:hypothetical protein
MKPKVVVLDVSQVDAIVKYSGFEGLSAVVKRGDYFFFSEDTHTELRNGAWYKGDNRAAFDTWIADLRQDGRILRVDPVLPDEEDIYDPNGKRHTKRGGAERWDMSARKFMALNPDYDFEVISRDKDFYENRNRAKWNRDAGTHAKIVDTDFRFTTMKKLMGELVVDPDLKLSEEQFMNIRDKWNEGFGDAKGFRQGTLAFPESYKQAQILQETARLRRLGGRFSKLARKGAPVAVLGLAAVPVISMVQARAEERDVSFVQAAGELGLEFTEDDLKGLAADVGVDLAVTLTPVGVLKKAWDVLGNIDDIVSLTQLYGEAFPENRAIQDMAAIARDVERSDAFATYVGGRDALVGVVGGAIDWVFGTSSDDAEIGQKLHGLRSAINRPDGAFAKGVKEDASADLLTGSLTSMADAGNEQTAVPLTNWPSINGSAPILPPGFSTGDGPEKVVASGAHVPSGEADAGNLEFEGVRERVSEGDPGNDPGRKTSYDRYRQLGATPEAEAEALRDFNRLHEESLLQMGGDRERAQSHRVAGRIGARSAILGGLTSAATTLGNAFYSSASSIR